MDWRLGRWECSACGNAEDPAAEAAARESQARQQSSQAPSAGSGLQRKPIYQDGKVVGYESAEDAGRYTAPAAGSFAARPDTFDPYSRGGAFDDSLSQEKRYWLMAEIGWSLILGIIMCVELGGNPQLGFQSGLTLGIFIPVFIIGVGIHLAIMWWILFGAEVWAKWTCLGCNGCGLLSTIASLLAPAALMSQQAQMQVMPAWLEVLSSVVQLGMGIWLISLLYRDIQSRQGL
ncbi:hypothetical protein IT575_13615 [bacterium]|nr:hypothetical protein [bacterium]